MSVVDLVRGLLDESFGNAGAVRNCRSEMVRKRDAERQIDALCRRVSPPLLDENAAEVRATA